MRWGWRSAGAPMRAWCAPAPSRPRSLPNSPSAAIIRPPRSSIRPASPAISRARSCCAGWSPPMAAAALSSMTSRRASRRLERARDRAQGLLDNAVAAAERAATETAEALAALMSAAQALELDPHALEEVEERLFGLRALARKHGVAVVDLPRLHESLA